MKYTCERAHACQREEIVNIRFFLKAPILRKTLILLGGTVAQNSKELNSVWWALLRGCSLRFQGPTEDRDETQIWVPEEISSYLGFTVLVLEGERQE